MQYDLAAIRRKLEEVGLVRRADACTCGGARAQVGAGVPGEDPTRGWNKSGTEASLVSHLPKPTSPKPPASPSTSSRITSGGSCGSSGAVARRATPSPVDRLVCA